jgi:hypothetical protein
LAGSSSHKSAFNEANPLLKFYYGNQIFLFVMCFLNESYFVLLAVKDDKDLFTAQSLLGSKIDGALGHMLTGFNWLCLAACVLKQVRPTSRGATEKDLVSPLELAGAQRHAVAPRQQEHPAHRRGPCQGQGTRLDASCFSRLFFLQVVPFASCRSACDGVAATTITLTFMLSTLQAPSNAAK